MSDDTTNPNAEQPSLDSLLTDLTSEDIGVRFYATNTLQRMAPDLARQVVALRAQVAAHEDADRRWSADMEALREQLRKEREFLDTLIVENDAMMGVPG